MRRSRRRGRRHGPGSNSSFKDGKPFYFSNASKTARTFVVSRSSRTTAGYGN